MSGEQALVSCGTSKGPILMRFYRDWSPHGYDRAVQLFQDVRTATTTCELLHGMVWYHTLASLLSSHTCLLSLATPTNALQGFFDHSFFFRNVPNFLNQFGITNSDDTHLRSFMQATIPDDTVPDPPIPFQLGTMSFAGSGPNSRTTQMFIAYGYVLRTVHVVEWRNTRPGKRQRPCF